MAWLQKIFTTVYEDRAGKRVSKNIKGAIKKRIKSKKWYAIWRNGKRRMSVPLAIDKQASLAMLAKLIRDQEYEAAGLINPYAKFLDKPITSKPWSLRLTAISRPIPRLVPVTIINIAL